MTPVGTVNCPKVSHSTLWLVVEVFIQFSVGAAADQPVAWKQMTGKQAHPSHSQTHWLGEDSAPAHPVQLVVCSSLGLC